MSPDRASYLFAFLTASVLGFTMPEQGLSFQVPSDPVSPTSMAECDQHFAAYKAAADQLHAEAKQLTDSADATQGISFGQWAQMYNDSFKLRSEANRVFSEGSRARTRCQEQVRAYERNAKAQEPLQSVADAVKQVPHDMLDAVVGDQVDSLLPAPVRAAREIRDAVETADRVVNGDAHDRIGALGATASDRLHSDKTPLDRIRASLERSSLESVVNVHRAAMDDLDRAIENFDAPASATSRKLTAALSGQTKAVSAGGGSSSLGEELDRAIADANARQGQRGQESRTIMSDMANYQAELDALVAQHRYMLQMEADNRTVLAHEAQMEAEHQAAEEEQRAREWQEEQARWAQEAEAERRAEEQAWRQQQSAANTQLFLDIFGAVAGAALQPEPEPPAPNPYAGPVPPVGFSGGGSLGSSSGSSGSGDSSGRCRHWPLC